MTSLSTGWISIELGAIATRTSNVDPSRSPKEQFELYSVPSYSEGKPDVVVGALIKSSKQAVEPNDVLLCKIVPHINRVWTVGPKIKRRQIASGEWIVYRNHQCDPHYLCRCLTEASFRAEFMKTVSGVGGSLMRARPSEVAKIQVPIAPLSEQRRIVMKIDSLLAKSCRARKNLDHIPRLVEKYKQAILAAAFRGELTQVWRERNRKASNTDLLKELALKKLTTRRSNMPTRNLVEPNSLPCEWAVVRIEDICSEVVDGTHFTPKYVPKGVPFISVKDIRNGVIDFSDCKYISKKEHDELSRRCNPTAGDLLITKSGTIGRSAVVQEEERAFSLFVSVALIRPASKNLRVKFLEHILNYWISTIDTGSEITGTAIKNLHLQDIKALGTPVPATDEQDEIVAQISKAYSWIDRLVTEATSARKLTDRLDQAILGKAFRGELVPQDPNDEPASVLLERIRADRDIAAQTKRGYRRRNITA